MHHVRVPFEVAAHSDHVVTVLLAWHASSWVGGHYSDILGFESWDIGPHVPPGRDKQHGETYVPRYVSRYANALEVALDVAHQAPGLVSSGTGLAELGLRHRPVPGVAKRCAYQQPLGHY